jgi:hypothetical protein
MSCTPRNFFFVAAGRSYTEAAHLSGVNSGDTTSSLVSRFNQEGLKALQAHHGGGPKDKYGSAEDTVRGFAQSLRWITGGQRGCNPHGFA